MTKFKASAMALLAALLVALPSGIAAAQPTGGTAERSSTDAPGEMTLAHRTVRHPDGSVEKIADPSAVAALDAATQRKGAQARFLVGCGRQCDGQDPTSYIFDIGPCSSDGTTIYSRSVDFMAVELRYSPRCRTTWTIGCCYTALANRSYYGDGNWRNAAYNYDARYQGDWRRTVMLDDINLHNDACFDVQAGGSPEWWCTSRY
jgi:hypothetical protein